MKSSETWTRRPPAALEFALRERPLALERVEHHRAREAIPREKISFAVSSQQFSARAAEKSFDRSADQHHARIAGEQHQAVLQLGHDLVHVVFQGGKNFLGVAHLAAQVRDLQRDQAVFVVSGLVA